MAELNEMVQYWMSRLSRLDGPTLAYIIKPEIQVPRRILALDNSIRLGFDLDGR